MCHTDILLGAAFRVYQDRKNYKNKNVAGQFVEAGGEKNETIAVYMIQV